MTEPLLRRLNPEQVDRLPRRAVDQDLLALVSRIVTDVRQNGLQAVREHSIRLGDLPGDGALIHSRTDLVAAWETLDSPVQELLERTVGRIRSFAEAQRHSLSSVEVGVPGGRAGHTVVPVERAGCYAPGGRYPLPSSVLMTAATARAAGVETVWVASPRPGPVTLAAAAVAGADGLLAAGGAQAIAALAFGGDDVPACEVVVGPGNQYVTAAKQLVSADVAIDMLAGPSEVLILADASAQATLVAADLLAQAEHDPQAMPILVSLDRDLIEAVDAELKLQLKDLPTADIAWAALKNGFSVLVPDLDAALSLSDRLAPEHLELLLSDPEEATRRARNYGALFIGPAAGEVLGDYGAGPNHVLPTGGSARHTGGLSVLNFLNVRSWLRLDDPAQLCADAAALARLEGLEAHARAAEARKPLLKKS